MIGPRLEYRVVSGSDSEVNEEMFGFSLVGWKPIMVACAGWQGRSVGAADVPVSTPHHIVTVLLERTVQAPRLDTPPRSDTTR